MTPASFMAGTYLQTAPGSLSLNGADREIHILSLRRHRDRKFIVKGWGGLEALDWTSDGKGLFTSSRASGSVLLQTDLQGNARVLWEPKGDDMIWAISSPDCHDVALRPRLRVQQQHLEHASLSCARSIDRLFSIRHEGYAVSHHLPARMSQLCRLGPQDSAHFHEHAPPYVCKSSRKSLRTCVSS